MRTHSLQIGNRKLVYFHTSPLKAVEGSMKQNRRAAGTNIARDERRVLLNSPIEMRLIVIPQTGPDIESGHTPISTVKRNLMAF